MRSFLLAIASCLFIGLCYADLSFNSGQHTDAFGYDKYGQHYTSHQESIQAAKKGASERLQQLGVDGNYIAQIGVNAQLQSNPELCKVPCDSTQQLQHDNFNSIGGGVGYVGYGGYGGNTANSHFSKHSEYNNQQTVPIAIPSTGSSSQSRYSEERERVQQAAPIVIPVTGGSERYSSRAESFTESKAAPAQVVYPSGGSERFSNRAESFSESKAAPIPIVYPSGGSQRYSSRADSFSESQAVPSPIFYPSGSQHYSSHLDQTSERKIAPAPIVIPTGESESYVSHSESHAERQDAPIQLPTTGTSERYSSRSERISETKPVLPVYRPSTVQRYTAQSQRVSEQSAPVFAPINPTTQTQRYSSNQFESQNQQHIPVYQPSASERYSSESERVQQTNIAPAYQPVYPAGSSSSKYSSHQESIRESQPQPIMLSLPTQSSSRFTSQQSHLSNSRQLPIYVPQPSNTNSRAFSQSESFTNAGINAPQYAPAGSSSQYLSQQSNSEANGYGIAGLPSFRTNNNLRASNRLGSQYGSSLYDGHTSSGLNQYISESERLARLQAQNVQGTGAYSGSSVLDSQFNIGSSGFNSLDNGASDAGATSNTGGYNNVKSWESSSKWSSGTKFDETGKPKTYGSLSTAEGEQHSVNGKTTGFKAATTTLEDDGKVSTYSIHTP